MKGIQVFIMKKLYAKGLLFLLLVSALCAGLLLLSAREPTRQIIAGWTHSRDFMDENEMLPYFEQARTPDRTTQLIIGDSICRQIFSGLQEYNPQMSIQATNAALMITGQYLLAREYLSCHPDATDVFLIMHPMPLTRTLDTEWSYRYAVMTYAETDTLQYLDRNTLDAMEDIYGGLLMQKGIVSLTEDSPVLRKLVLSYISLEREPYVQSSPFEIADQYVKKLYDFCVEKDVKLHLYPSPCSESFREQVEGLAEGYGDTWMSTVYPDFFDAICYYPDAWSEDLSHFSGEHATREAMDRTIREAYAGSALLDSLILSPVVLP